MKRGNITNGRFEKAVLVALISREQNEETTSEYLEELAFLSRTLGIVALKSFTQKVLQPDPRSFVGRGKLEDIKDYVVNNKMDVVIFDDDLSPSQLRNLEKDLDCKIYDRSLLILDIFLRRAQTSRARTQVELARNQYLLPRLTRMWTHLERQRGGTATRGGAGEKEIETDRRIIRDKITALKKKLEKIDKQAFTQRKSRDQMVKVSLVGYTNVGKSTLMRRLSKSDVFAEDKLFATVDSTVRKVVLDRIPFLLTDTVGFIRKLPHTLIESFKSTLDEVREADILIHVVDISHPHYEDQIRIVNDTLREIEALNKPTILAFNKIDKLENSDNHQSDLECARDFKGITRLYSDFNGSKSVFISAEMKENLESLRSALSAMVRKRGKSKYPNPAISSN